MAKVTSKGQVTIPKAVREHLGIEEGDRLTFQIRNSGEVVMEPEVCDVSVLRGLLPRPERKVTLEEMERAIAEGAANT